MHTPELLQLLLPTASGIKMKILMLVETYSTIQKSQNCLTYIH